MSYNGTVRCSYCYRTGHNSRTCPTKNEHLKQGYERAIEQGDYRADTFRQEYEARTGLNIVTGEEIPKSKRKVSKVHCSYCRRQGHTRRTCEYLKADKKVFAEISKVTRKDVWESLVNQGVGVGSLIPIRSFEYLGEDKSYGYTLRLRYVDGFDWESCHWGSPTITIRHKDVRFLHKPNYFETCSLQALLQSSREHVDAGDVPAGMISATSTFNMPAGWLDFEDAETVKSAYKLFFTTKKGYEKRRTQFRYPNEHTRSIIIKLGLTDQYPNMISS